ncbi:hypothetical protein [Bradyrhizobium sp. HKCCYLS1011]|uniref:hypothetical protein n=1 Tax=Bradyrhizobium sp. HKCCYLS1011 TaxID=3420733 RepID=UPI003EBEC9FE
MSNKNWRSPESAATACGWFTGFELCARVLVVAATVSVVAIEMTRLRKKARDKSAMVDLPENVGLRVLLHACGDSRRIDMGGLDRRNN